MLRRIFLYHGEFCFKMGKFPCSTKKYMYAMSCSWSQLRCSLYRMRHLMKQQQAACHQSTNVHPVIEAVHKVSNPAGVKQSCDEINYPPDMVKLKAEAFNLEEGAKSILDILDKTVASTVVIFVRTSVLAEVLVDELKENNFDAKVVDKSLQFDNNRKEKSIFVISDKMATTLSVPPTDLLIQVQAPLSGIDIMKQRLHVNKFTNMQKQAVLLYNSNDVNFIAKLSEIAEITGTNSSLHPEKNEKQLEAHEVNLSELTVHNDIIENNPAVSRKVKTTLFKPVYPQQRTKSPRNSFVDRVRLYAIGGSGGNGSPRTGARGGDGGDVILQCQSKATLRHFRFKENRRPKAGHGQHCSIREKRVNGARGADLIIPVPLGTVVRDETTGHVIADMNKVGQRVKVVSGGHGGSPLTSAGGGEKGEKRMVILEYKMYTDVGLVGFPNAGKSTLLKALSNAKPKVADYAFTSLSPTLGRIQFDNFSQFTLVDLPGLIEGAHKNRGLGLKFLRHIERARILMFVVDVNGFQLSSQHQKRTAYETICLLAKELMLYKEDILTKPKLLVLNKIDCVGDNDISSIHELVHKGMELLTSTEHGNMANNSLFEHVLAVSALNQTGIEKVQSVLQELIRKLQ
ncbi:GTP-binding protein 10-like isoform X2 [Dendronephthya gigantea]|uniref:GTP-binding protein 10-like isoform X2 n=1 Tax=Dendronephthya gigantea TaxID=151771 RepID=UPI001069E486|nr:GTP-binding protein 10-like isoform X2 [Dendronephthya gigantea]